MDALWGTFAVNAHILVSIWHLMAAHPIITSAVVAPIVLLAIVGVAADEERYPGGSFWARIILAIVGYTVAVIFTTFVVKLTWNFIS